MTPRNVSKSAKLLFFFTAHNIFFAQRLMARLYGQRAARWKIENDGSHCLAFYEPMSQLQEQLIHILLVEDDEVETEAVIRAFDKKKIHYPLVTVSDGIEALKVLRGETSATRLPQPYIIFLDLNMPRMSGFEFLSILRQDPTLQRSVVFVLTTSNRTEDKLTAYDQHIAGYLLKAEQGNDFGDLIQMLQSYCNVIEFPPATEAQASELYSA